MNEPQGHRPVSTTEIVAGEVRAYLGRRRLSGRAAAMQLGWTQQYMSRRLTGVIPFDVADLAALADLLEIPIVAFFEGTEEIDPSASTSARTWMANYALAA
jgi:transcriptional regulator with XRE-family HTH domain